MRIKSYIKKCRKFINDFRKFRRHGGVTYVNVAFSNPNERFVGKKVFISGGSEGLGRAMAEAYLKEGAEVLVTGRSKEKLDKFSKELNNPMLHAMIWDATDFDSYTEKFNGAVNALGHVDIFVNNVGGGMSKYESWEQYSPNVLDSTYNINSKSMFLMCQMEGRYMIDNHIHGNILNITSIAGYQRLFDPYAVSKWGEHSLTGGLAKILIPHDIVVNGIAPGTCLTSNPALPKGREFNDNAYLPGQPSHRFTMPEEIAAAALFLTSGEARQIVGYILPIDGGVVI